MIIPKEHFDFDDLNIVPASTSTINSRSECNVFDKNGMLPLFAAPMDTVVSIENKDVFLSGGIYPIIPRNGKEAFVNPHEGLKYDENKWIAIGLQDMEKLIELNLPIISDKINICLDIANGHMEQLFRLIVQAKKQYGDKLVIMAGNIAHPDAYMMLSNSGADYVRVGIGSGCFVDGTKIITSNGEKSIENVKSGDTVLTHKGNFKKVGNTKHIKYQGKLVKINNSVTCTPDHKIYVLNKKHLNIINDDNAEYLCEWVSAMELYNNSNYLLVEMNTDE